MTMRNTVMTGLVGLLLTTVAHAETKAGGSVQEEVFAHNKGVLTETKARGTWDAEGFDFGYFVRNRLTVGYDGTVQETLMQELSFGLPFLHGFQPTGQILLKDNAVAPQAGIQYAYKTDDLSISTAAVWRFQQDPVIEWRTTAAYSLHTLAFEAENFTWFAVKDPALSTGTVRLHAGYSIDRFQVGVAGEVFYPVPNPVAGVYGRVKF